LALTLWPEKKTPQAIACEVLSEWLHGKLSAIIHRLGKSILASEASKEAK
jgi:hypothetical protein